MSCAVFPLFASADTSIDLSLARTKRSTSSDGEEDVILFVGDDYQDGDSGAPGALLDIDLVKSERETDIEYLDDFIQNEKYFHPTTENYPSTEPLTPRPTSRNTNEILNSDIFGIENLLHLSNQEQLGNYENDLYLPDRFTRAILHSSPKRSTIVGGGEAGKDFPNFSKIPRTDFSCQERIPGYYADESTACQVRISKIQYL